MCTALVGKPDCADAPGIINAAVTAARNHLLKLSSRVVLFVFYATFAR
jgi:hypothetical protein